MSEIYWNPSEIPALAHQEIPRLSIALEQTLEQIELVIKSSDPADKLKLPTLCKRYADLFAELCHFFTIDKLNEEVEKQK